MDPEQRKLLELIAKRLDTGNALLFSILCMTLLTALQTCKH